MCIAVFAETQNGNIKKSSLEAVNYAANLAQTLGLSVKAICIGSANQIDILGQYGAQEIVHIQGSKSVEFNAQNFATTIVNACKAAEAQYVIVSNTYSGKSVAPAIAYGLQASLASNVISMPNAESIVKKSAYSGKAFSYVKLQKNIKVIAITPNSFEIKVMQAAGSIVNGDNFYSGYSSVQILETKTASGKIPLTEAEIVVSGGRGLKGPENWGLIENLAEALGAATACSKPVSDMHWRPHSEHVGQTGITIKPNLYIAVGISGAIQHLAGVSSSKVIVAINKDPEAPFFKAADYGIVGDAFEILPKLTEAIKQVKNS